MADVVSSDVSINVSSFMDALGESLSGKTDHTHSSHDHSGMNHDHSDHEMAGHHMMKMWFHGGCEEVILFDFWRIDSCLGLFLSCVAIFIMGALYEGVKWFRVYLQLSRSSSKKDQSDKSHNHELDRLKNNEEGFGPSSTPPCHSRTHQQKNERDGPLCVFRIAEALLYSLQLVLAYWLMLIVMTYNTWLTIAVIGGAAFGHWLFAILNLLNPNADGHDSFTTDACH